MCANDVISRVRFDYLRCVFLGHRRVAQRLFNHSKLMDPLLGKSGVSLHLVKYHGFSSKYLLHLSDFATFDDFVAVVGQEQAEAVLTEESDRLGVFLYNDLI